MRSTTGTPNWIASSPKRCMARLSEPHRAVLALRYMDDRSVPECAEALGRTVHATEALLVRARRAFRQQYPEGGTSDVRTIR